MRLASFFSGALCALSGGRLPEALFMVFLMDSKGAKVPVVARMGSELGFALACVRLMLSVVPPLCAF